MHSQYEIEDWKTTYLSSGLDYFILNFVSDSFTWIGGTVCGLILQLMPEKGPEPKLSDLMFWLPIPELVYFQICMIH